MSAGWVNSNPASYLQLVNHFPNYVVDSGHCRIRIRCLWLGLVSTGTLNKVRDHGSSLMLIP